MKRFEEYASFHRTLGNQVTHLVGIPLIVFSLLGLLSPFFLFRLGGWRVDAAQVLWAAAALRYCSWDFRIGVLFSWVLAGVGIAASAFSWKVHLILFVFGWVSQFIGHFYWEKKAPAFLKNLEHLLVGPFWIFCKVLKLS